MSVTVIFESYSDLCEYYSHGKEFLDLPEKIIEALDLYFEGKMVEHLGKNNPNNVYINYYNYLDSEEVVTYQTKLLSEEEYHELQRTGKLESWLEQNRDRIQERLSSKFHVLGYDSGDWHVLDMV